MCSSQNNKRVGAGGGGGGGEGRGRDSGWPFIFVDDAYLTRRELSRNKK